MPTAFDVLIAFVIFLPAFVGYYRGFYQELIDFMLVTISAFISVKFSLFLNLLLLQVIKSVFISTLISFITVMLITIGFIKTFLVPIIIRKFIILLPKTANQAGGITFGALKGYIVAVTLLYILSISHVIKNDAYISASLSYRLLSPLHRLFYSISGCGSLNEYITPNQAQDDKAQPIATSCEETAIGLSSYDRISGIDHAAIANIIATSIKKEIAVDKDVVLVMLNKVDNIALKQIKELTDNKSFPRQYILPLIIKQYYRQLKANPQMATEEENKVISIITTRFLDEFDFSSLIVKEEKPPVKIEKAPAVDSQKLLDDLISSSEEQVIERKALVADTAVNISIKNNGQTTDEVKSKSMSNKELEKEDAKSESSLAAELKQNNEFPDVKNNLSLD